MKPLLGEQMTREDKLKFITEYIDGTISAFEPPDQVEYQQDSHASYPKQDDIIKKLERMKSKDGSIIPLETRINLIQKKKQRKNAKQILRDKTNIVQSASNKIPEKGIFMKGKRSHMFKVEDRYKEDLMEDYVDKDHDRHRITSHAALYSPMIFKSQPIDRSEALDIMNYDIRSPKDAYIPESIKIDNRIVDPNKVELNFINEYKNLDFGTLASEISSGPGTASFILQEKPQILRADGLSLNELPVYKTIWKKRSL